MKNRVKYKNTLKMSMLVVSLFIIFFSFVSLWQYKKYEKNFNDKLILIIANIKENYPTIDESKLMQILNSESVDTSLLDKYSLDLNNISLINPNNGLFYKYLLLNISIILSLVLIIILIFIIYERKKSKEINEIIKCIEQINKKNYALNIDKISEDELSILRQEIYKTTIMLKEDAYNSKKDKLELKDSLSNISHQLKTPLTSILIILENLEDNPDMDNKVRLDFIRDIKREIININFLVQSLLKLSKLETNTVHFLNKKILLKDIVLESVKNVSLIAEVKNVKLIVDENETAYVYCDEKWQIEAFSNIIKNCIEHSYTDGVINIRIDENNLYTQVLIKDNGDGISKKDIKHIFDRFYKGENSSHDSIGIGLSLAKTIIEKSNGNVSVTSDKNGTEFVIKYFK